MAPPTYRIPNWNEMFETAQSRKVKRLSWVAVPTAHDGCGFRTLMRDAPEAYGAWVLMLQVAAKMQPRGTLASNGARLEARHLAIRTGAPQELFEKAFEVLTRPEIGWLEIVPKDELERSEHASSVLGACSDRSAILPGSERAPGPTTLQNNTEQGRNRKRKRLRPRDYRPVPEPVRHGARRCLRAIA